MNTLTQQQVQIVQAIQGKRASFVKPCQPESSMTIDNRIVAKTKSDALVLLGQMEYMVGKQKKRTAVALKITFLPKRKKGISGSQIELKIYERVVQALVLNQNTPNVAVLYASHVCDYGSQMMPPALQQLKRTLLNRRDKGVDFDFTKTQVLIMERVQGLNVQFFLNTQPGEEALLAMLFQVLYTLVCFERMGVRHNDLHLGNVHVAKLAQRTPVNYFVDEDTFYRFDVSSAFVKIFDFERASMPSRLSNPDSDALNLPNYKYDLFFFLTRVLLVKSTPVSLKKKLRSCCMSAAFAHRYADLLVLCKLGPRGRCVGKEAKVDDNSLNTPMQFIKKLFSDSTSKQSLKTKQRNIQEQYKKDKPAQSKALAAFFRNSFFLPNV